ncbi:MAG: glycosyltransferase family 9 protein [Candidatus Babeliales bacterium]
MKKILWIRPDALGDAVLSASMLPAITQHFAPSKLIVVCQHHATDFYKSCPYVDEIISCNKNLFMLHRPYRSSILDKIRCHSIDIVFNTMFSRELAFDCCAFQCGAPMSVAFKINHPRGRWDVPFRYNHGYTRLIDSPGHWKLELERYKDFLDALGITHDVLAPHIWINGDDEVFADRIFASHKLIPNKTFAFFAGAQSLSRVYQQYDVALNALPSDDVTIVALGTNNDAMVNERALAHVKHRVINLSGMTTIRQAAAIIKRCRLALGAETGLAHVACAVGTPNIIILGGGHFGRFMPYSPLTAAVVAPHACYRCDWRCKDGDARCVQSIHPHVVAYAVKRVLECRDSHAKPLLVMQKNCAGALHLDREEYDMVEIATTAESVGS